MTAFTSADIPASVDTVEKLAVWLGNLLNYLNPAASAVEGTSENDLVNVRSAQFFPYLIKKSSTEQDWQIVTRQSIAIDPNWQTGESKIWSYAQEISTLAIPASFKV